MKTTLGEVLKEFGEYKDGYYILKLEDWVGYGFKIYTNDNVNTYILRFLDYDSSSVITLNEDLIIIKHISHGKRSYKRVGSNLSTISEEYYNMIMDYDEKLFLKKSLENNLKIKDISKKNKI